MGSQLANAIDDKRRRRPRDESATEFLRDFPALLALDRLAVPILAVDDDGDIVFANEAFAAMVGHSRQALVSMNLQILLPSVTPRDSQVVPALREHANSVVRLWHADGWPVPAVVSDSVLIRENEAMAVVAFTDLSELAWHTTPDGEFSPR
jgi:PAS domain S-box-containing protein